MPQRAVNILLAVLGLVTVLGIVMVGTDLRRASRTGPRWKRKLISAGLALLAALGIASTEGCRPPWTCYVGFPPENRSQSTPRLQQLDDQLAALEKEQAAGTLEPEVVRKRLGDIEARLAELDTPWGITEYPQDARGEAVRLREAMHQRILDMRIRLTVGPAPSR